jgi:hypothetical protein
MITTNLCHSERSRRIRIADASAESRNLLFTDKSRFLTAKAVRNDGAFGTGEL